MSVAVLIARVVFGGLFIYASLDKILNPADFALIVHNYQVLPALAVNPVALFLPWLELVCGVFLILGRTGGLSLGAAGVLCGLMLVFTAAVGFNWARGLDVACGCFTTSAAKSDPAMLFLRDIGLLALGAFALFGQAKLLRPGSKSKGL